MPLRKLKDCDKSDMQRWASSIEADNFFGNIAEYREVHLRRLIKEGTKENAASVRAFDYVLSLWEDTKKHD